MVVAHIAIVSTHIDLKADKIPAERGELFALDRFWREKESVLRVECWLISHTPG